MTAVPTTVIRHGIRNRDCCVCRVVSCLGDCAGEVFEIRDD